MELHVAGVHSRPMFALFVLGSSRDRATLEFLRVEYQTELCLVASGTQLQPQFCGLATDPYLDPATRSRTHPRAS